MQPKESKESRIENRGQEEILTPGAEAQPAPAAPETAPAANANAPAQSDTSQPVQLPQIPATPPPLTNPLPSSAPATPLPNGNPAFADDVDVIEKEWVDQADKIVERTKNDPYMEEEAIESLQIDYLKKRYGHDVKKPDNLS